jgi:SNF2 family DNA or RNA helicase
MVQVANVGLNLVAAADINFQDELFVPGLNQQAIDRAHRIGQDTVQPVRVRTYIAAGTIENRIQQILKTKKRLSARIVDSDVNWKKILVNAVLEDEEDAA